MPSGGIDNYSPRRVAALRAQAGRSYRDIAALCDVTIGTARNWEKGRLTPSAPKAKLLADALGVHPADLTTTPLDEPTLTELRQWCGLHGPDAADRAGIGTDPLYNAETYTAPPTPRVRAALARAYGVSTEEIAAAWNRGRHRTITALTTTKGAAVTDGSQQAPDAVRDNFRSRISLEPLSAAGAATLWDGPPDIRATEERD